MIRPFCVDISRSGYREQRVCAASKRGLRSEGREPSSVCRALVLVSPRDRRGPRARITSPAQGGGIHGEEGGCARPYPEGGGRHCTAERMVVTEWSRGSGGAFLCPSFRKREGEWEGRGAAARDHHSLCVFWRWCEGEGPRTLTVVKVRGRVYVCLSLRRDEAAGLDLLDANPAIVSPISCSANSSSGASGIFLYMIKNFER